VSGADLNIVLVGAMGAGKTAVGRALARRLGRRFVDTDREVERRAGKPVAAIFATEGEATFRALERDAIVEAAGRKAQVVATGGGAVVEPTNLAALRATGVVVYLAARPETLAARVGGGEGRPLLGGAADRAARLREIVGRREAAYRQADVVIETDGLGISAVAAAVLRAVRARGVR
jgi:shikimate kinase